MKKNKKKNEEIKETNYKVVSKVLILLFILVLLLLLLLVAFKFIENVPSFGSIFFVILPVGALIILFLLIRNMYKDMVTFDKKVRNKEKILDQKLKEKEERRAKERFSRISRETDII